MTSAETKQSDLTELLRLRLLVGILGEKSRLGWWQTSFFDPSSQAFLTPAFVKTSSLAQYHGVVEAARRVHDENLSAGSFHLFRFHEETEQDLHLLMQGNEGARILSTVPRGRDEALQELKAASGSPKAATAGPVSLGKSVDLSSNDVVKKIASIYHSAFAAGVRSFPYFVE